MMEPEAMPGAQMCAPEPTKLGPKDVEPTNAVGEAADGRLSRRRKLVQVEDLPPPGVTRWVIRRKAQVVEAVQAGMLTVEQVCDRYSVSLEEFRSWQRSFERHGLYGLRTTRSQIYRSSGQNDND
jgi:hypothetical protein